MKISKKGYSRQIEEALVRSKLPDISTAASFINSSMEFSREAAFSASEMAASLAAMASLDCWRAIFLFQMLFEIVPSLPKFVFSWIEVVVEVLANLATNVCSTNLRGGHP
jgi:hypothetical protein